MATRQAVTAKSADLSKGSPRLRLVVLAKDLPARAEIARILAAATGAAVQPVFRRGRDGAAARYDGASLRPRAPHLERYVHAILPADQASEVLAELERSGLIERGQVLGRARPAIALRHAPPFVAKAPLAIDKTLRATPSFLRYQGYLGDAPNGLGIRRAWGRTRARGEGVKIIDIEWGWNLGHEDLRERVLGLIHGVLRDDDHGTAVVGILGGDDNQRGILGIAPNAHIGVGSGDDDDDGIWNPEGAIEAAMDRCSPGDVLLLEMHTPGPLHAGGDAEEGLVPVEYGDAAYDAIRAAVDVGIHVVAAAGNGWQSLDDGSLDGLFDPDLRDSGAVLVGAGESAQGASPRHRLPFSNWGRRVDLQGWGERVATTGGASEPRYHDLHPPAGTPSPDPDRCYTASFSGTSSAAPLVAGIVALAVSACRRAGRVLPDPATMRALLVESGSPQPDDAEHIGPLPNADALFDRLEIG